MGHLAGYYKLVQYSIFQHKSNYTFALASVLPCLEGGGAFWAMAEARVRLIPLATLAASSAKFPFRLVFS